MKKEKIKKTKPKNKTCNQCAHSPMHGAGHTGMSIYFCPRMSCPNFALLQIPMEFLEDLTPQ